MNLSKIGLLLNEKGRITKPDKGILDLLSENESTAADYGFEVGEQLERTLAALSTPFALQTAAPSLLHSTKATTPRSRPKPLAKKKSDTIRAHRQRVKKKLDLEDIDEDIREMDLETLRKHFGYNNGNIKLGIFCRNVVWQCWRFTQAGQPPEFVVRGGNTRSLRYYVKKITDRHTRSFGRTTDFHKHFVQALSDITGEGLISYRDLNFIDGNRVNRWVAPAHGVKNVVVMAEKRSFAVELLDVGKRLGVTVQCTGGVASRVTVETMLLEMADAGHDLTKPFVVFAMVDFDPAGWNIADQFVTQMLELGLKRVRSFWPHGRKRPRQPWIDIVDAQKLEREILDNERHPLKDSGTKLADKWITATGGLYGQGGKKWALSSEAFFGTLEENLIGKLKPFLPDPYLYPKVEAFRSLPLPLKDFVSAKLYES